MGRELSKERVPKYIREVVRRLELMDEPYRIKVYSRHKVGGVVGFVGEVERLISWCRRWGAEVTVIEEGMWWNRYVTARSAYGYGHRNFYILEITDPVMLRFEKDGFYKEEGDE